MTTTRKQRRKVTRKVLPPDLAHYFGMTGWVKEGPWAVPVIVGWAKRAYGTVRLLVEGHLGPKGKAWIVARRFNPGPIPREYPKPVVPPELRHLIRRLRR
ncbi:MAG: hypothetical protein IIC82_09460 [Chloroflexi bacterium]|nr:hypothetical protein [Chloroflexota bacterium]